MLLPALEADLVERMPPVGRTCLVRVGRTLGAGVPNRIEHVLDGGHRLLRSHARRRILPGNGKGAFAGMRIGTVLIRPCSSH